MPDTKHARSQHPSWLSWGAELASLGGGGGRGILEDVVADVAEAAVTRVGAVTEAAVDV